MRLNWNLELLIFTEGRKPEENPRSKGDRFVLTPSYWVPWFLGYDWSESMAATCQ
jgi:hypothetical protein